MIERKPTHILFTWIGFTDIRTMQNNRPDEYGSVAQALKQKEYDQIELISNYEKKLFDQYLVWLQDKSKAKVTHHHAELTSPVNFGEIYQNVTTVINAVKKHQGNNLKLTFHLSPGTPAMAAVWIILAKTRFSTELIESSKNHGVNIANIPFDISAEFIPLFWGQRFRT